jgi:hypothetical protein
MQRTLPPGPPGHRQTRHPSAAGQQGLGSPSRQQNVTLLAPSDHEPSLHTVMEAIQVLAIRVDDLAARVDDVSNRQDDTQRQIQDLVALFARTNSPPVRIDRIDRSQSPATMQRPSHIQETRFGTAPPSRYGHPRRQYEPEYTYAAPNLIRARTVAPEARFDTSPTEKDIYGQRQPQPQLRDLYLSRERTYSPPTFVRNGTNEPADLPAARPAREGFTSKHPAETPPVRPSGDARIPIAAPKDTVKAPTFASLGNFSKRTTRRRNHDKEQRGILASAAILGEEESLGDELDILNRLATDMDERKGWERERRQFKDSSSSACHEPSFHAMEEDGDISDDSSSFESRKPSSRNRVTENDTWNDSSDSSDSDDDDDHGYRERSSLSFRSNSSDSDDDDDDHGYQEQSSLSFCSDCSNSDGDYGYQEQSSSCCCSMEMSGSDGDAASDAASDEEGLDGKHTAQDNLYEISSNGLDASTLKSTVLPIYDADITGTTRQAIINSGASTLYVSQKSVQELGLRTTEIKARSVKVVDHSRCTVDRIATVDVKVGNLPTEPAYVFPDDEGYESSNMHGDEYEDEYRDSEPSTHNFVMSHQRHKNHGQVLRDGRGGE